MSGRYKIMEMLPNGTHSKMSLLQHNENKTIKMKINPKDKTFNRKAERKTIANEWKRVK